VKEEKPKMRKVSILPWLLLVLLFLFSGLNAAYVSVPGEYGFYVSTKTWDEADHVYVYSQKTYPSISYYVALRTFWRENTLFIIVDGVDRQTLGAFLALLAGPASTWISRFDELNDGTYNIVLVWDGGSKGYLVTKQNVNIEVTDVNDSFSDVFLLNILFLAPWVSLIVCFGLFAIHRFRAQLLTLGKKLVGRMTSTSVKKKTLESLNKARIAIPLLVAGIGVFYAFLAITQVFFNHTGAIWASYRLFISASIIYLGWLFYRIVKAKSSSIKF